MEWLEMANLIAGIIMVIVTIVLVCITRRYVILTGELVKSTNKPEIFVSIRPHETHIYCVNLCIENIGTGVARDVKFTGDLSFAPDGELSFEELGFIKKGISDFGPGHKIVHFLVSMIERKDLFEREPLEINVTYKDSLNNPYERNFSLDFSQWENLTKLGDKPIEDRINNL